MSNILLSCIKLSILSDQISKIERKEIFDLLQDETFFMFVMPIVRSKLAAQLVGVLASRDGAEATLIASLDACAGKLQKILAVENCAAAPVPNSKGEVMHNYLHKSSHLLQNKNRFCLTFVV